MTREDIEIRPYVGKTMMNQSTSGYEIPFRYPDGVAMRDQKDRKFCRCRFCSPYPADKNGKRAKYGVLPGASCHWCSRHLELDGFRINHQLFQEKVDYCSSF